MNKIICFIIFSIYFNLILTKHDNKLRKTEFSDTEFHNIYKKIDEKFLKKYLYSNTNYFSNIDIGNINKNLSDIDKKVNKTLFYNGKIDDILEKGIPSLIIFAIDILLVIICEAWSCCPTTFCKRSKNAQGKDKCSVILHKISIILYILIFILSILGILTTYQYYYCANATASSFFIMRNHLVNGLGNDYQDLMKWYGFEKTEEKFKTLKINSIENYTYYNLTEENETFNYIHNLLNSAKFYMDQLKGKNFYTFQNNLNELKNYTENFIDNQANKIYYYINKYINPSILIVFFIYFEIVIILCIISFLILSENYKNPKPGFRCLYIIIWNLQMVVIFISCAFASFLLFCTNISYSIINIMDFYLSKSNLNQIKIGFQNYKNIPIYLNDCLYGNGDFYEIFELNKYNNNTFNYLNEFLNLHSKLVGIKDNIDYNGTTEIKFVDKILDEEYNNKIKKILIDNENYFNKGVSYVLNCKFLLYDFKVIKKEFQLFFQIYTFYFCIGIIIIDIANFFCIMFAVILKNRTTININKINNNIKNEQNIINNDNLLISSNKNEQIKIPIKKREERNITDASNKILTSKRKVN